MSDLDTTMTSSFGSVRNSFFDLTGDDDNKNTKKTKRRAPLRNTEEITLDLTNDDDDDDSIDCPPVKRKKEETHSNEICDLTQDTDDQDEAANGEVTFLLSVVASPRTVQQEEAAMNTSNVGRSVLLVRRIMELHQTNRLPGVEPISRDEMVLLAQRFLECQEYFESKGVPSLATLAYHYTAPKSLESIKTTGLLTPNDQRSQKITSGNSGGFGTYGSGIYVGSNPYAFQSRGGHGLLVAVLFGSMRRVRDAGDGNELGKKHNTVVGNKARTWKDAMDVTGHFSDEYVLQESWQCLPLLKFDPKLAQSTYRYVGSAALWGLHQEVQTILDELMHRGQRTKLVKILPCHNGKDIGSLGAISFDQERDLTRSCSAVTSNSEASLHGAQRKTKKSRRRDPSDLFAALG